MGEIIKFPDRFGERLKAEQEQKVISIDIDHIVFVLNTISSLLRLTPGRKNDDIYQNYFNIVSRYSDQELASWLNSAEEKQIAEKPLFFRALIDVARERPFWPETKL